MSVPRSPAPLAIKEQPVLTSPMNENWLHGARRRVTYIHQKVTTRQGWLGNYNYAWLCTPTLPFAIHGHKNTRTRAPPFYALDAELPLVLAMACGLQHALAMLAGLITPPIILAGSLALDNEMSAYLISASLIGCGMCFLTSRSVHFINVITSVSIS